MSLFRLALANLRASPLSMVVNVLLLALGTASIAILLIANTQLSGALSRNAAGIDLVIGAKGSPLQLVLAGVYHADVPPGNIPLKDAEVWMNHSMIKSALPLSLGDSFLGHRIVGTTPDYAGIYEGELIAGELWDQPFEAVIGARVAARTGLAIGDSFSGVHGLSQGGDVHDDSSYRIVGQYGETGTVLDNLILTSLDSVWLMHGHDQAGFDPRYGDPTEHTAENEITLLLVKFASPLAALSLPREINSDSALQAASPAFEISRLLQIVGIGLNWLNAFALVLVVSAALSIFAALYSSLRARRQNLAVLRCLGATRGELFYLLFVEGLILTVLGIVVGLFLAHGGIELLGIWVGSESGLVLTGLIWAAGETLLVFGLLVAGMLTALLPAWQAYSTNVPQTLSTS